MKIPWNSWDWVDIDLHTFTVGFVPMCINLPMPSCSTRRHVLLLNKNAYQLAEQEDMRPCTPTRQSNAQQEHMSSCPTRRHAFLFNPCLLAEQEDEDLSYGCTRSQIFLLNSKTCLLVEQEDMSSIWTRGHVVFLWKKKKKALLVQPADVSSC